MKFHYDIIIIFWFPHLCIVTGNSKVKSYYLVALFFPAEILPIIIIKN